MGCSLICVFMVKYQEDIMLDKHNIFLGSVLAVALSCVNMLASIFVTIYLWYYNITLVFHSVQLAIIFLLWAIMMLITGLFIILSKRTLHMNYRMMTGVLLIISAFFCGFISIIFI
jgi:hypothetical protein